MTREKTILLGLEVEKVGHKPAYIIYMQSTSGETLGWKKHRLESRFPGEISITSDLNFAANLVHL